ncbi:hypothetical protein ABID82_003687 [Methylobacterium sp. PvP062]|jgi:hypothetical protein|uniref:Cysteine rich repeat protein n=2 Tax=Methylobacterium radiotolerans TaxID=31998 RepID=B1M644_METRJ|nr:MULTISPECIES: hypothetical protein [Methylobacterium]MCX7332819.1 hypothetical protein [Hyphomicrobiales bacterium]GAN48831.1 hypothetical protein ME121_2849 [Methylobacterium sp. ME121]ACB22079.1 hypothetical protein Mrad2831_0052 [Methylobacterium radiotolerans JCM 2831]KIU37475.1 hypothetical protein SR39_00440 [Methylobacterium radiotolerans]KTS11745.1 hypothetical protein SB3_03815 [Methylobacterium radiotolerans]
MKSAPFALVAVLVGASPTLAETSADRAACTPDVMRLCAAQIPNAGAITLCLREKRGALSGACRTVVDRSERPAREIANRR